MKRQKKPDAKERNSIEEEANAVDALSEGFPEEPLPAKGLPTLTVILPEEGDIPLKKPVKDGKGFEKALKILDEYEKGVPPRNPHVQNYEE